MYPVTKSVICRSDPTNCLIKRSNAIDYYSHGVPPREEIIGTSRSLQQKVVSDDLRERERERESTVEDLKFPLLYGFEKKKRKRV